LFVKDGVIAKPWLESDVSVREAILRALEDVGIDMIFGMPGGYSMPLFDALHDHRSRIRTVLCREESLAGIMAEVYGRLTGRPGVALGQAAFMLNTAVGLLEARLSCSPMIVLTDFSTDAHVSHHGPYQSGSGMYGSWNAAQAFSALAKSTFVASGGAQTVQCTQLAIKHALTGERGPVVVLYPLDSFRGRVGPDSAPQLFSTKRYLPGPASMPDEHAARRAAELLMKAQRPVIIAGNGVRISGAYASLQRLADLLAAPVATSAGGKSAIRETHDLALGVFGNFGTPLANAEVAGADVVLVVGSKLAPSDTANESRDLLDPERQSIIQIDVEPLNASWTFPSDPVVGDAGAVLDLLTQIIDRSGGVPETIRAARRANLETARKLHGFFDAPEMSSQSSPPIPQRIIRDVQRTVADDAFICCDAGENRIFMTHYFQSKTEGTFLQPAGIGAMGYAIPAAMAAKLVHPERQAIAVCGDGGFGISMNGLLTCVEENIPIVVVVFNNSALGWVNHGQGERAIASELGDFDHAAIAQAMGCVGYRVETAEDIRWALDQALASGRPAVVDIKTSLEQSYTKVLSPLVAAAPRAPRSR
jgi:acetolactate synthase I/II/III large subunit